MTMDAERFCATLECSTPKTPKEPKTPWVIAGIIIGTVIYFLTRHA